MVHGCGKDVRWLNPHKLIAASCLWSLDIQELTRAEYRAFIEHVSFISIHAKDDYFKDSAHVDYVLSVHRSVEYAGFGTCSKLFDGESVVHYGAQNTKARKAPYQS